MLIAVGGGAVVVVTALGFWAYANVDHLGILDDPDVMEPMAAACREMKAGLPGLGPPTSGTPTARVAVMRAQDTMLTAMISRFRAIGQPKLAGDDPALDWIADWDTILSVRHRAESVLLERGTASIQVPIVDGEPITHRMEEQLSECAVPAPLLELPQPG